MSGAEKQGRDAYGAPPARIETPGDLAVAADFFGGDLSTWPKDRRAEAEALAAREGREGAAARAELAAAQHLDGALSAVAARARSAAPAAGDALRARMLADADRVANARRRTAAAGKAQRSRGFGVAGWLSMGGVAAAGALAMLLLGDPIEGPPVAPTGAAFDPAQAVAEDFGWSAPFADEVAVAGAAPLELAASGDLTALELLDLEDAAFWRSAAFEDDAEFWDG